MYAEVPPRVEYELTPIAYELKTAIKQLESWEINIRQELTACFKISFLLSKKTP
ncbi:winged helix-turn-helix transcriptional regulator [Pedobacter terrae]|uniref:winged helix-turn-helix transcriptional regulator n=1 Tax=Pedobacter terrae TaxID=405671 RepID=UPI0021D25802|nr:winged helix-turn-helix transcriptional regulator [Pedobacter terrae]